MSRSPVSLARMSRTLAVGVSLLAFFAAPTALADAPRRQALLDFDRRTQHSNLQTQAIRPDLWQRRAEQSEAAGRLAMSAPGLRIDWDPLLETPRFIRSTSALLTPPAQPGTEPLDIIESFVIEYDGLFQLGDRPLDGLTVIRDATTVHNGVRTIWLGQSIDGLPVMEADLRANITTDGQIVSVGSRLLNLNADAMDINRRSISAVDAIKAAAASIGVGPIDPVAINEPGAASEIQRFTATTTCAGALQVTERYLPISRTEVRRVTRVIIQAIGDQNVYEVVIAGDTGEPLVRRNLSRSVIEPATYRVFVNGDPTPLSPGPPFPNGVQPPQEPRSLITIGALDPVASPEGWIPAGESTTAGNNIAAQTDLNFDNIPDLPRPFAQGGRVFDFPFTLGAPPEINIDAAVTQAFYMGNWFHDIMYGYGFTEPFGNYQNSNFDRGGVEGDAIQIDVLDGGGDNNARFISQAEDGSPGRVEMFLWTNGADMRNSAFDNQVLLHELAHSVSLRLLGGVSDVQSIGMSEGWSDFIALALLSRPGDNLAGVYPIGAYLAYTSSNPPFLDNYYFGIRRYPYSIDFNANPLTFADIDSEQFDVGQTAPRNPLIPFDNPERVHQVGEVWCQILWECRAELVQAHGYAGNEIMLRLVVDAMKLTTTNNPNMVIGRDAILLADLVNNNGENVCRLRDAFARRGLGTEATSPDMGLTGVVESFQSDAMPTLRLVTPAPARLDPGAEYPITITTDPGCAPATLLAPIEMRVSVNGGAYTAVPMSAESSAVFHAAIPALECGDQIAYYFAIEYDSGAVFSPPAGESLPYRATAEIRQDLARIRAADREAFDFFGFDVDIQDDTALVGAFQEDEAGFDSGAVYVYRVSPQGDWQEIIKLMHPTGEGLANFGYSVAVDREMLVVGAIGDDMQAINAGAAYIYRQDNDGAWALQDALTALDGESDDRFGFSVDIENGVAIVGAPNNDTAGANAGAVYIYTKNGDNLWTQQRRILAEDGSSSDLFGHSVSISGDTLALGAPGHEFSAGAVYLYQRQSSGLWSFIAKLMAPAPRDGALFGEQVHLNGDLLIVGAANADDFFAGVGAAYIYRRDPKSGWSFQALLTAPDQRGQDLFGSSVAIEDNLAVVGARRSDAIGPDSGAIYTFVRDPDGAWPYASKIVPEEAQARINLGNAAAIDQGLLIAGAWTDGLGGSVTGSAYLIRPVALDCDANGIADACDIAAGDLLDVDNNGVPDQCQCLGDLNGDRRVDTADLGLLLNSFGSVDPTADLNLDGYVDQADLGRLLLGFDLECTSNE